MTWLRSALARRPAAERSISYQDVWGRGLDLDSAGNTAAGASVSADGSLRLAAVWACVRVFADSVGSLPVDTYRRDGDYRRPVGLPKWLDVPNPETTRYELWEQTLTSLLLHGNAYWAASWNGSTLLEVWPLDPTLVTPKRNKGRVVYHVRDRDSSEQAWWSGDGPTPDIVHLRAHTTPGRLLGMSPIEVTRQAVGLGIAAEEFGARWFGQGSQPAIALTLPPTSTNPTAEQLQAFKGQWEEHHRGTQNAHRPAVLPPGASLQQLTIPPDDSQFIETRKFQTGEIARIFRVPPHMIGDLDRATFSNIEHQSIEFVEHSLRPWLVRLELAVQRLLPTGRYLRFNVDGLLRGDIKSRYEAYAQGRMWGWLSANDVRALEDEPPLDVGDIYLQPVNMVDAGAPPPAPAPEPEPEAPPLPDEDPPED